jgi:AAA+ ATPase superfamily predicted ATPase
MFIIKKANRKNAKLRLALTGVSNSGKTTGALKIAKGLGGKIVVIDTENKSADLYSDITDFDTLVFASPLFTRTLYSSYLNNAKTQVMTLLLSIVFLMLGLVKEAY